MRYYKSLFISTLLLVFIGKLAFSDVVLDSDSVPLFPGLKKLFVEKAEKEKAGPGAIVVQRGFKRILKKIEIVRA